jgi:hypothetical protein
MVGYFRTCTGSQIELEIDDDDDDDDDDVDALDVVDVRS